MLPVWAFIVIIASFLIGLSGVWGRIEDTMNRRQREVIHRGHRQGLVGSKRWCLDCDTFIDE